MKNKAFKYTTPALKLPCSIDIIINNTYVEVQHQGVYDYMYVCVYVCILGMQ